MWLVSIHAWGGLEGSQEGRSRGIEEMFLLCHIESNLMIICTGSE